MDIAKSLENQAGILIQMTFSPPSRIPERTLKKRRFWDFEEKCTFDRKTNATSVFISSMAMIFIFGFAKNYLLEKKLRLFYDKF